MNLSCAVEVYGFGTPAGLRKAWDERGRGRKKEEAQHLDQLRRELVTIPYRGGLWPKDDDDRISHYEKSYTRVRDFIQRAVALNPHSKESQLALNALKEAGQKYVAHNAEADKILEYAMEYAHVNVHKALGEEVYQ